MFDKYKSYVISHHREIKDLELSGKQCVVEFHDRYNPDITYNLYRLSKYFNLEMESFWIRPHCILIYPSDFDSPVFYHRRMNNVVRKYRYKNEL